MICSHQKRPRILVGVSEGDYYAHQFGALAATLPDARCRYLGFSWSAGLELRRLGLDYRNLPWGQAPSVVPSVAPPVSEMIGRRDSKNPDHSTALKALRLLRGFIENEIKAFSPDIVIYGPSDHAISYLLDSVARSAGIPQLGIQPSFILNHFIAHTWGLEWQETIQKIEIIPNSGINKVGIKELLGKQNLRTIAQRRSIFNGSIWLRGAESLARILVGGPTFYTFSSLYSTVKAKIAPPVWFPSLETIETESAIPRGCILLVLNQPTLQAQSPDCVDLIRLVMKAAPPGVPIVIRPHPVEASGVMFDALDLPLRARGVKISRVGQGPGLTALIEQCGVLITLTSAVGVEALIRGKPVFTFGPAFYARPGMAVTITQMDVETLKNMLERPEAFKPDCDEVGRFMDWLVDALIVPSPTIESHLGKTLAYRITEMTTNKSN